MIICICNNITESDLHVAVGQGLTTLEDLRRDLGIGAGCGACESYANEVLTSHLNRETRFSEISRRSRPCADTALPAVHADD